MSHRAFNDKWNSQEGSVFFSFLLHFFFNLSWQLMFDKKQKSCVKCIPLVTDDGLYDQKAFYKVKIVYVCCPLWRMANKFAWEVSN